MKDRGGEAENPGVWAQLGRQAARFWWLLGAVAAIARTSLAVEFTSCGAPADPAAAGCPAPERPGEAS